MMYKKNYFYNICNYNLDSDLEMLLIILPGVLIIVYYFLSVNYEYWNKRKVPNPVPSIFFGNIGQSLTLKRSVDQIYDDIYKQFPNSLYVGFYKIRQPGLIVRDPKLIKDVLNKEFNSFHDNELIVDETSDPIGGKNPFALKGEKWKIVKNQLSPSFTTKKLREMYVLVEDSVQKLINYLEMNDDATGRDGLEARELFAKYGTEVVASCAFGLEGKSFDEPDPIFRKMGRKIFEPSLTTVVKIWLMFVMPFLSNIFKLGLITKDVTTYFQGIVTETLKYRKENNIVRKDFLDSMLELKNKSTEYKFTDLDITAHAVGFFVDGFETSSATMTYIMYELVSNPEVFEKLRLEIDEALIQNTGKLDYDSINELKYLEAVINESMRMHPAGMSLSRVCTKPFKFPPPQGPATEDDINVEVHTPIVIPVYGLHYDTKYFKDPHTFDPDRFSSENKESIVKGTYLPFGDGPRACPGQRFALMQMKLAIVNIVAKFDVTLNKKTIVPLEIDPKTIIPHAKGGIWLNFHKRKYTM